MKLSEQTDNRSGIMSLHSPGGTTTCFIYYRVTRMHSADYAVAKCLSVRLFARPSVCLSKRLYISTRFFHHSIFPYQT